MKASLLLTMAALAALFLQAWLFPALLPFHLKPELLLLLVVYLGGHGEFYHGAVTSLFLGWLQDSMAGNTMGLFGLVFLIIYCLVRYGASRFNAEAMGTFYFLVFFATLAESLLVCFFQSFFSEAGSLWYVVVQSLFPQMILNMAFAFVFLNALFLLQWVTSWSLPLPGPSRRDVG